MALEPDKENIGKFIKYIPIQKDEYLETFSKIFNPLVSKSIVSSWEKRHFLPNYKEQYKFIDNLEVYGALNKLHKRNKLIITFSKVKNSRPIHVDIRRILYEKDKLQRN